MGSILSSVVIDYIERKKELFIKKIINIGSPTQAVPKSFKYIRS